MFKRFLSLFLMIFLLSTNNLAIAQETEVVNPKSDFTKLKQMLGKTKTVTITYPHTREPAKFGDVFFKLNFEDATAEMGNKLGTYKGYFFAVDNVVCAASKEFFNNCFVFSKTGETLTMVFFHNQSVDIKFKIE
jgi:hypothetical protein